MTLKISALALMILVFLSGCASSPTYRIASPQGTSQAQWEKDNYECNFDTDCLTNYKGYTKVIQ